MIRMAEMTELDIVIDLVRRTIETVYPRYYPKGAVDFFINHHKYENVKTDMEQQMIYVLEVDGKLLGTVTIKENEIARLFVEPDAQGKGYGGRLLQFAEENISQGYDTVRIASSFPAKAVYLKKGYKETAFHQMDTGHGDYLCYDEMEKKFSRVTSVINYDGKFFTPKSNTENGEVDGQTLFSYHQNGDVFFADYCGGEIRKGYMIGTVEENGVLDFYYQHINVGGDMKIGRCHSVPHISENGKIELYEEWQWLNGDKSKGSSVVAER